jgi:hypothetical protein
MDINTMATILFLLFIAPIIFFLAANFWDV